jgi:hypothetical protein
MGPDRQLDPLEDEEFRTSSFPHGRPPSPAIQGIVQKRTGRPGQARSCGREREVQRKRLHFASMAP